MVLIISAYQGWKALFSAYGLQMGAPIYCGVEFSNKAQFYIVAFPILRTSAEHSRCILYPDGIQVSLFHQAFERVTQKSKIQSGIIYPKPALENQRYITDAEVYRNSMIILSVNPVNPKNWTIALQSWNFPVFRFHTFANWTVQFSLGHRNDKTHWNII